MGLQLCPVNQKGKLASLRKALQKKNLKGKLGIGHTRWATHGVPNDINAHPQFSNSNNLCLSSQWNYREL